jgi:hypothetical protein
MSANGSSLPVTEIPTSYCVPYGAMLAFILSSLVSFAISAVVDGLDCGYTEICKEESLALLQTAIVIQHKERIQNDNHIQSNSRFAKSGSSYDRVSESSEKAEASQLKEESSSSASIKEKLAPDCTCCPETCNAISSKLELVHITKTGGTAMESWGYSHGFLWGQKWFSYTGIKESEYGSPQYMEHTTSPQHVPPQWFTKKNPYDDYEMFTIVRDPYSRIISEFRCPHYGFNTWLSNSVLCEPPYSAICVAARAAATVDDLNTWVIGKLNTIIAHNETAFIDGHMIPQHFYIYGKSGEFLLKPENVLRQESLDVDFAALKERYNITGGGAIQKVDESEMRKFSVTDLSAEARQLIERVYREDFDRLGYSRL